MGKGEEEVTHRLESRGLIRPRCGDRFSPVEHASIAVPRWARPQPLLGYPSTPFNKHAIASGNTTVPDCNGQHFPQNRRKNSNGHALAYKFQHGAAARFRFECAGIVLIQHFDFQSSQWS